MKKKTFAAAVCVCLSILVSAQKHFYYYENSKIELIPDSTSFLLIFDKGQLSSEEIRRDIAFSFRVADSSVSIFNKYGYVVRSTAIDKNIASFSASHSNLRYTTPLLMTASGGRTFVLPSVVTKLREGHSIEELIKLYPTQLTYADSLGYNTYLIQYVQGSFAEILNICNALHSDTSLIAWAEPEFQSNPIATVDPGYPSQYYLNNTGPGGGTPGIDIKAEGAWAMTTGTSTITVAVIDTSPAQIKFGDDV